ncbi:MAG: ThiF family adenylyltransferase [Treponema sp.]|nr:ThiF family adenylyltransferase [Treponema sp.]
MEALGAYERERFSRQIAFEKIGEAGQERLLAARVVIFGAGALGTVAAESLCRAGVGFLRLVDRDRVELSNLQRQALYDEADALRRVPKAQAAAERLSRVNSRAAIEPVVAHVDSSNVLALLEGCDLAIDGSDNMELRLLLNEACRKAKIPWIYGGAIGSTGSCMVVPPDRGPCLRCLVLSLPPAGSYRTCASAGVMGMATGIVASVEAAEAIKIIIGTTQPLRRADSTTQPLRGVLSFDLWAGAFDVVDLAADPDCPVCARGEYPMLEGRREETEAVALCGLDEYQIVPARRAQVDLGEYEKRLAPLGKVERGPFMLGFSGEGIELSLFHDGRAILRAPGGEMEARAAYSRYVGL